MAKKAKRRVRTKHIGVKILTYKRTCSVSYVARWTNPITGKSEQQAFSKLKPAIASAEARTAWAIDKAFSLAKQKAAIASGTDSDVETTIKEAVDGYYSAAQAEGLKPATLTAYRIGTVPFAQWCDSKGIHCTEQITSRHLESFRKWFILLKAKAPAQGKGAGRGSWTFSDKPLSPFSINKGLASVRTVLNQWRRESLLPNLSSDDISDHLRRVKVQKNPPHFLRSSEIISLLKAAKHHDEATYSFARRGTTHGSNEAQYTPVYEFVLAALLTGCRFEELGGLRWDEVNLEANEILIQGNRTKTGIGRRIALDVTPALKGMLERMKIQKGKSKFVFSIPTGRNVKRQNGSDSKDLGLEKNAADRARKRLLAKFDAPVFTWHDLRRTCGTYLACAPAMYAGAAAFHAAKRLGHTVAVSEKYYAGVITDIPKDAETLESAMGIESFLKAVSTARTTNKRDIG